MIGPSPFYVQEVQRPNRPVGFYLAHVSEARQRINRQTAKSLMERLGYGLVVVCESDVIPGQIDLDGRVAA